MDNNKVWFSLTHSLTPSLTGDGDGDGDFHHSVLNLSLSIFFNIFLLLLHTHSSVKKSVLTTLEQNQSVRRVFRSAEHFGSAWSQPNLY